MLFLGILGVLLRWSLLRKLHFKDNTGVTLYLKKKNRKMTEASASVCLILATALDFRMTLKKCSQFVSRTNKTKFLLIPDEETPNMGSKQFYCPIT